MVFVRPAGQASVFRHARRQGDAPLLGPFRTFQVPIRDIASQTELDLEQLVNVDRMPIASALPTARTGSTWRRLHSLEDLDLVFDSNSGNGRDGKPSACPNVRNQRDSPRVKSHGAG